MTNSLINLPLPPFSLTFATIPFTFVTLIKTPYLNYAYHLYYSSVPLVSYMYDYIYCASEDTRSSLCVSTPNTVCNLRTLLFTYLLTRNSYLATTFRHRADVCKRQGMHAHFVYMASPTYLL